jgi:hypothetical protein
MSKREKDERWLARKVDDHWAIVEPILPTARHTPPSTSEHDEGPACDDCGSNIFKK